MKFIYQANVCYLRFSFETILFYLHLLKSMAADMSTIRTRRAAITATMINHVSCNSNELFQNGTLYTTNNSKIYYFNSNKLNTLVFDRAKLSKITLIKFILDSFQKWTNLIKTIKQ